MPAGVSCSWMRVDVRLVVPSRQQGCVPRRNHTDHGAPIAGLGKGRRIAPSQVRRLVAVPVREVLKNQSFCCSPVLSGSSHGWGYARRQSRIGHWSPALRYRLSVLQRIDIAHSRRSRCYLSVAEIRPPRQLSVHRALTSHAHIIPSSRVKFKRNLPAKVKRLN